LVSSVEGLPKFSYKVSVHDQATVNAVALPGGNIIVFKGLLTELKSENEVAMILAHELGHYAHRDHLHGIGQGACPSVNHDRVGLVRHDLPGFIAPSVQKDL
jgi:Zn-dependent protease with chaperone function